MHKSASAFLKWLVNKLFRIEVVNPQNMPENGAFIACINHISAWDPLVLGLSVKREIRFLAKSELFKIPLVGWFMKGMNSIPIKRGASDVSAVKAAIRTLNDNNVLGIFPTGTRERVNKNAPVKSGVALIAVKTGVPVVPIHIQTEYKLFRPVKIFIGNPMDFSSRCDKRPSQNELCEIADEIYTNILELGDKN